MRRHRALSGLALLGLVATSACSDDSPLASDSTEPEPGLGSFTTIGTDPGSWDSGGGSAGLAGFVRLVPFDSCPALLAHVTSEAAARVGPYGLDLAGSPWGWGGGVFAGDVLARDLSAPAATEAPAATTAASEFAAADTSSGTIGGNDEGASSSPGGPSVTGTNTQEAGVDEPDIIKTDGTRIITITNGVLTYVDITSGLPQVTGTLQLHEFADGQLFLAGDRAYLLSNSWWAMPFDVMPVDMAAPPITEAPSIEVPATDAPAPTEAPAATDAPAATVVPGTDAETQFVPATIAPDPSSAPIAAPIAAPIVNGPTASIVEIDLSDPGNLRIAATLRLEGQSLSARAVGDRLLLALASGPTALPFLYPQSAAGEQQATEANQRIVAESTLADWTPQYVLDVDGTSTSGDLLDCAQVDHPTEFSGFDLISLLGLSLSDGLATGLERADVTGVLAGGQTVYSSIDRFYVATTSWVPVASIELGDDLSAWTENYATAVHAFDITTGRPVEYLASGEVPGTLLNSFSLDEHQGYLRILTTTGTPWGGTDLSETRLTVLEQQGPELVAIGQVGGLGQGEQLYSARLVGDRGYAVTFRQIDPLYVLDLSDPSAPTVTGELKIPGFSTYLHPFGEHRLLGLGQDATEQGGVLGLKLSLFDVSDPAAPRELSVWTLPGANSAAEYDHHAFQMVGSTVILPIDAWGEDFHGAVVLEVGDDAITERGRITHAAAPAPPVMCPEVAPGTLPETSPLYWTTVSPDMRVQVCGPEDGSGYGDWYCDVIPFEAAGNWFGPYEQLQADLAAIGVEPDGRIEMCYPNYQPYETIQRSVVVDETLWTMGQRSLQANDLASLQTLAAVTLG